MEAISQQSEERKEYYDKEGFKDFFIEPGSLAYFNSKHGYLEAIVRGFRSGFLSDTEYRQLTQCEKMDDFKLCFQETDFCDILQSTDMNAKLTSQVVVDKVWEKFVEEFLHLRNQATGELATFLHFIQYEHMIKNVSFLISGLISQNDPLELLVDCDEFGKFPGMRTVLTFENVENGLKDLYRTVLIDTPIGKYFEAFFEGQGMLGAGVDDSGGNMEQFRRIFNEQDIDLITDTVLKYYLEDFYRFCRGLGGATGEIMCGLLEFEADKRAISIMINSFNTGLNEISKRKERQQLFCSFGSLYPEGINEFEKVSDQTGLKKALSTYARYDRMWAEASRESGDEDIADALQMELEREEVRLNVLAFEQQSHFAAFYAYAKLKEFEKRNIYWICECLSQGRRDQIETKLHSIFVKHA